MTAAPHTPSSRGDARTGTAGGSGVPRKIRLPVVVGISGVLGFAFLQGVEGWLTDGWAYALPTIAGLVSFGAATAAVVLGFFEIIEGRTWALFSSRRPAVIATLLLVAMLSLGLAYGALMAMDQGETHWEPSDKGWFAGWVVHFLVVGGLLVVLWWRRSRSLTIVVAPLLTGVLAFRIAPPAGWVEEDSDFRADATAIDGFSDVLPHTFVAALLMGVVVVFAVVRSARISSS